MEVEVKVDMEVEVDIEVEGDREVEGEVDMEVEGKGEIFYKPFMSLLVFCPVSFTLAPVLDLHCLEDPKSANFITPSLPTKQFAPFRSL